MKAIDKQRFTEIVSMLASVFERGLNEQQVIIWWKLLEPYNLEDFEYVSMDYMRADNAFMPKPGQIIALIQQRDGRPTPEQAWNMVKFEESETNIWTREMESAFWAAFDSGSNGDKIAARMAFLEVYKRDVTAARAAGEGPHWSVSLGHDKAGRERAILNAVEENKLTSDAASSYLPNFTPEEISVILALPRRRTAMDTYGS